MSEQLPGPGVNRAGSHSSKNDTTEIAIDWSKVDRPGWFNSADDLPIDASTALRTIIEHDGTLRHLNDQLMGAGLLEKPYESWEDVTHALAAILKHSHAYTPEQIAEVLLADLPCNQYIANEKDKDKERAIERAISRSAESEATIRQITGFMSRVVPWPGLEDPGYAGLHWSSPQIPQPVLSKPFRALDDFLQTVLRAAVNAKHYKEVYFCLSLQEKTRESLGGGTLADRKSPISLKAIWLDIDVKPDQPDKHYTSKEQARHALDDFIKIAALPYPTAIIDSGGGYHVYWISQKALTVEQWRPYAECLWMLAVKHQLLADPVTTDDVRILRVPGTYNRKQAEPRPCRIIHLEEADLDFTAFDQLMVETPTKPARDFESRAHHKEALLDAANIIAGCPHFNEMVKNGGADHEQGLWMLDVLAATFLKDGRQWAHRFSDKYKTYAKAETDEKFDLKMRDHENGIGWPSCEAFERSRMQLMQDLSALWENQVTVKPCATATNFAGRPVFCRSLR